MGVRCVLSYRYRGGGEVPILDTRSPVVARRLARVGLQEYQAAVEREHDPVLRAALLGEAQQARSILKALGLLHVEKEGDDEH